VSELILNERFAEGGAENSAPREERAAQASGIARFFVSAGKRPGLVISVLVIALVIVWALAPSLFTHQDPLTGNVVDRLQAPSAQHIFGTDNLGRDLWARVVYGAAQSLAATFLAVVLALVVGSLLGLLAGFLRGWVDDVIMRVMDVVLAIPTVLLSLAIITALGFGTVNVAIAVGFASAASFARVMRSEVITISTALYVEAARASGVRWYTVLRRHVLPNSLGPVLSLSALEFGTAVLAISSLSFLGFGAPPPAPEWGALISEGRNYLATSWWLTTFPGLIIVAVVLAANRISRAFEKNGGAR
jgi:peptide/nickel transport system permease protein